MSLAFVVPTIAVVGLSIVLGFLRWPSPPRLVMLVVTTVAAMGAALVAILFVATEIGFLADLAGLALLPRWCGALLADHPVGGAEGAAATGAVVVMALRVGLVVHRRRAATRGTAGKRIAILETPEPVAYAAPGRPGCVVVSSGLLAGLDPRERQVVFAHERAHLQQRHDRYLLIGALAQAIVPVLGPLVGRLRLATERCADEAAVRAVGGDRRAVASAIGKAALTTTSYRSPTAAFGGGAVIDRVEALVGTPPTRAATALWFTVTGAGVALAVGAGSIQLHHLWVLLNHICGR